MIFLRTIFLLRIRYEYETRWKYRIRERMGERLDVNKDVNKMADNVWNLGLDYEIKIYFH